MSISTNVKRYVAIKRGLGYQFADQEYMLQKYAAFADAHGDRFTSISRIVKWASAASSAQRSREWFRVARHFAISMHAEDNRNEIPPRDAFGRAKRKRPRPHVLASADIDRIMQAALSVPPIASITPYTYHYMIGLLATTGLRVSEAIALLDTDLVPDGLLIRETKFRKTRLVPIHRSTRTALAEYIELRRRIGGPSPHLFVLSTGEPPDRATVTRTFVKLAQMVGLRGGRGQRGPRLHDLRHSFAVRSLEQCGSDRAIVNRHMLALSTYLGHACLSDTYWYLEATPVLTRQIANAAETFGKGGAL
jgi:integrase